MIFNTFYRRFRKIEWESRYDDHVPETGPFKGVTFAVDVTECPVGRPDDRNLEYYLWSHKAGACTLKYQGTVPPIFLLMVCFLSILIAVFSCYSNRHRSYRAHRWGSPGKT